MSATGEPAIVSPQNEKHRAEMDKVRSMLAEVEIPATGFDYSSVDWCDLDGYINGHHLTAEMTEKVSELF